MPSREILNRNAEALRDAQPALANGLIDIPDALIARFEKLEIPDAPQERLLEFAAHAKTLKDMDALVLLGLGTPMMMQALRDALPSHVALIVLEPALELAFRMLSQIDLSDFFSQPHTALVMAADDTDLQRQIENLVAKWGLSELQMVLNPMRPVGDEIAQLAIGLLRNGIENVRVAAANVSRFGDQIIENIAANIDAVATSPNPDALASCLQGEPVVIVGAGPSLDRNLKKLREVSDRVVVIALDAALGALRRAEVPVDVVVSLDVIGEKAAFLKHLDPEMILVSLLGAHPSLVSRAAPHTAFVSDEHPLSQWCATILGLPHFPSMGNVAHLGLLMGLGMGAGNVLFIGVDFAMARSGALYAAATDRGNDELPKELEAKLVDAMAYDGQPVKTLPNMLGYASTLSAFAGPNRDRIFNANPEALRVNGVAQISFDDFMAKHGKGAVSRPLADSVRQPIEAERIEILKQELGPLESELRAFAADASTFADDADAARVAVSEGKMKASDAILSLSEGAGLFARHRGVIDMIEPLQPAVSFEIAKLTREMTAIQDPVERAQRQLFTLSGPAASGAQIAEAIADRLRTAAARLRDATS